MTKNPWDNVYGVARSLIATGTLATLLFNSTELLFMPAGRTLFSQLPRWWAAVNFFVLFDGHLEVARWIAALVCLSTVIGWRPRWTAVPHAWVTVSFASACVPVQGGDQIAGLLALLLVPVAVFDERKWHWTEPDEVEGLPRKLAARVAHSALSVARLQVAVIYLWAGVHKLSVPEWANGSALYYWVTEPAIGVSAQFQAWLVPMLSNAFIVGVLTWAPIVLEVSLFLALSMGERHRRRLLPVAVLFHLGNILFFGLVAFFFAMVGALALLLGPRAAPFRWPAVCADLSVKLWGLLHRKPLRRDPHAHVQLDL